MISNPDQASTLGNVGSSTMPTTEAISTYCNLDASSISACGLCIECDNDCLTCELCPDPQRVCSLCLSCKNYDFWL